MDGSRTRGVQTNRSRYLSISNREGMSSLLDLLVSQMLLLLS
jgi:hypothetical protein